MKNLIIFCVVLEKLIADNTQTQNLTSNRQQATCGIDNSPISVVYEGYAKIETYPWLGTLYYPMSDKWMTTSVVLVSKQIAIGAALDVDKVPKIDFRSKSRVVIGTNCSGPALRVKDYSFHPDYPKTTLSALALIQLENDPQMIGFRPICAPPTALNNAQFYSMTLSNECHISTIRLQKMAYVDYQTCKEFYRQTELDIESMWPPYVVCARAMLGKSCVWRSGTVLALRQNNRWSLVGVGVAGPGCNAPARFMEYNQYRPWVRNSVLRIGRPTVTRIADNQIIMRRSLARIQRYGPCDPEEIKSELYTDHTKIEHFPNPKKHRASYNFTIFANFEYSCIVFQVFHYNKWATEKPKIYLHKWCLSPKPLCYGMHFLQIDFYVEIFFKESITYRVMVYGQEIKFLDIKRATAYFNTKRKYPGVPFVRMGINTTGRR
ncbi:uncharacterized protein LOC119836574 [Zerene cesonia]|uniref:uncharacterized protein LOC119836574 n=1 Tax=Zerene cesonia TaxID=33412 RepID=UPI0018E56CB7|nr:uncharacterized protein LOC119836574 [Zerene cesonia]